MVRWGDGGEDGEAADWQEAGRRCTFGLLLWSLVWKGMDCFYSSVSAVGFSNGTI